ALSHTLREARTTLPRQPVRWTITVANGLQCTSVLSGGGFPGIANQTIARTKYRDYAFYFQDTYKILDQLKVTTGIRWTNDLEEVDDIQRVFPYFPYPIVGPVPQALGGGPICSDGGALPDCKNKLTQQSQAPTWLVDFDYTPFQDLLLYAKYTRGYREGTINPTAPVTLQNVDPEKVDTYEVGEKF